MCYFHFFYRSWFSPFNWIYRSFRTYRYCLDRGARWLSFGLSPYVHYSILLIGCSSALQVGFYFTILPVNLYILPVNLYLCRSATHTRVPRCSLLAGRHAYPLPGADVGGGASSLATRARLCPPRLALTLSGGDRTWGNCELQAINSSSVTLILWHAPFTL